jgi:hypothetical protein
MRLAALIPAILALAFFSVEAHAATWCANYGGQFAASTPSSSAKPRFPAPADFVPRGN